MNPGGLSLSTPQTMPNGYQAGGDSVGYFTFQLELNGDALTTLNTTEKFTITAPVGDTLLAKSFYTESSTTSTGSSTPTTLPATAGRAYTLASVTGVPPKDEGTGNFGTAYIVIPEPSAAISLLGLSGIGLLGLVWRRRRSAR